MRSSYVVEEQSQASPEVVFRLLADAPGWERWAGPVVPHSSWESGAPQGGVGAVRRLGTGPLSSREEITEFEPPRRLAYVLRSGESLHHYRATVDLTAAAGGGTRILWSGTVESGVPGVAPALCAVFHALVRGFARRLARAAETAPPAE